METRKEVNKQPRTYTYPQTTVLRTASSPGSNLDRHGGSILNRRQQPRPIKERASDLERRKVRLGHVEKLLENPEIYDIDMRGPVLRRYVSKYRKEHPGKKLTKESLSRWLTLYWQGGRRSQSLISNYFNSGRLRETTPDVIVLRDEHSPDAPLSFLAPPKGKARGRNPLPEEGLWRRPKNPESEPSTDDDDEFDDDQEGEKPKKPPPRYEKYLVSESESREIIEIAWAHYKENDHKSFNGAYTTVIAKKYIERDENGEPVLDDKGKAIPLALGKRPSDAQIYGRIKRAKSLEAMIRARKGRADWENNYELRLGTVRDGSYGPGDVYEIDSTILDVFVVDRASRTTIIGKATCYFVVDRWSKLIVGWHVSLDNPSWAEAKLAILSIFADWRVVGRELRVKVHKTDLVAQGLMPNKFFADRADMHHGSSDRIGEAFDVECFSAPSLISVAKSVVESQMKARQRQLRQFFPGYDPPELLMKRRRRPYAKAAVHTLESLRAFVFRNILRHNRTASPTHPYTERELMLNLPVHPLAVFERDRGTTTAAGSYFRHADVVEALRMHGRAKVMGDGIHFGNCRYTVPELRPWLLVAGAMGTFPIDITYETSSVDTITVIHPRDPSQSFTATLTRADRKWSGLSFAERHFYHLTQNNRKRKNKEKNVPEEVTEYLDDMEMNEEQTALTKAAIAAIPYGTRLSKGPDARTAEKRGTRLEALKLGAPTYQVEDDGIAELDEDEFEGGDVATPTRSRKKSAADGTDAPTLAQKPKSSASRPARFPTASSKPAAPAPVLPSASEVAQVRAESQARRGRIADVAPGLDDIFDRMAGRKKDGT